MILLSNKATKTPFFRKIKGGVKGFECQVFIKNGLINAKLALKRTLVLKILFQYEILVSCKSAKFQKTNKQPP
ncbi:hypothetical protein HMPREF1398_01108 [Helicobacter pylori GAM117Ai]|uniref:hypothetical protein n=1 Tax=Helicobacter pylori TaxID=210 RepID=UPI00038F4907|nr:hypothetical protein [Helicobacter pylori]ERA57207.1 hypothetical protein HMPREF1398_01108 [Helicobacter pylori GAM117Ai]